MAGKQELKRAAHTWVEATTDMAKLFENDRTKTDDAIRRLARLRNIDFIVVNGHQEFTLLCSKFLIGTIFSMVMIIVAIIHLISRQKLGRISSPNFCGNFEFSEFLATDVVLGRR